MSALETVCLSTGTAIVVSLLAAVGLVVAMEVLDGRSKFCQP